MGRGAVHLEWKTEYIAVLRLDNPQARNAVSIPMMHHFEQHCAEMVQKNARVVLITSTGERSFCAGGDLQDVRSALLDKEAAREMNLRMATALGSLRAHNIFTLVVLNGAAVGGGAELSTYGDIVFAVPTAFIAFVHAKLGVSPGWGGGMRLFEKVGTHTTRQLLLSAQKISASRAERIGLVDVIAYNAYDQAMELAKQMAEHPQESMERIGVWCANPSAEKEKEVFLSLWGEEPHREALGMKRQS